MNNTFIVCIFWFFIHMFSLGLKCSSTDGKRIICNNDPYKPNLQKGMSKQNLGGQFHQPEYVEHLLGLKYRSRLVCGEIVFKRDIHSNIIIKNITRKCLLCIVLTRFYCSQIKTKN